MRSSSHPVVPAQLRASDAERDEAIGELRHRFAEGRLSHETFLYRMDAALRAKDHAELSDLFIDLPPGSAGPSAGPSAGRGSLAGTGRKARGWLASLFGAGQQAIPRTRPAEASYDPVRSGRPRPLCLPRQEDGRFTIGRAPSCDFTVADLSVSRWHARLHKEEQTWMLSDLGSTNGTRLNGWRVTKGVRVRLGDQVSFGSVTYVITDGPSA